MVAESSPSETESAAEEPAPWFLRGGGLSGQTARAVNWAATPLGPAEQWPSTLKTTLATIFRARQPMFLWWGPDFVQFYNDAYLPSFGSGKHPRAMGQPGRDCWQEIWHIIGPQIDDVMDRALGSLNEDALVPIFRNGKIEEVYWTYTYSPVFGEDGRVAATLVICTETTSRVLGERRMGMLHRLVGDTSIAHSGATLDRAAFRVMGDATRDVPLVALYGRDPATASLIVRASAHVSPSDAQALAPRLAPHAAGSALVDLGEASVATEQPGASPVREIYVVPLEGPTDGFLAFGISPQLSFDQAYRQYLDQVAGHIQVARIRVAEEACRAAVEVERRNLLEQAPVATALIVGPQHVFEVANPLFCQMVGRPDLIGKAYLEAFPELAGTDLPRVLDRVYRNGEPFATNEYLIPIDRGAGVEPCFFKFNVEPVRNAGGEVYAMMAVAVEITDQVNARRALEHSVVEREGLLRSLETANRAKDEFLAMLGHELRNPLSPIVTALRLMRAEGVKSRGQEVVERQVKHMVRLVDDLLDVSKIARGKVELRREIVDLNEVVARAVEMASDLLEQRKHRLSVDCAPGSLYCDGDPVRLSQIVANLLTNAARYTEPGGAIAVTVARVGADLVLTVADNGIGIAPETLPRIFRLFEQGHRSTDRSEGGLGIGLALVENLVTLHGGSVSVHSDGLGRGSRFTVRLQAVEGQARKTRTTAQEPDAVPNRKTAAMRIMVVDDNVDAAEMLRELLEIAGHEVAVAHDALAALDLAARFGPDVAVLDIGLPVMDGYELGARLRTLKTERTCRIVALTGYGQQHDRQRSLEAGFDEHLVKPIDIDKLIDVVSGLTSA